MIALGGAAGLVLTPDAYATSMGYFSSVGSDPERQKEHQQLVDQYLAQLNAVDVDAYLKGGNADNPTLAAAIRTTPGGF